MSGVSMCWVVLVGGRERGWLPTGVGKGAWWLPAGGIRASQGTFSSYACSKSLTVDFILAPLKILC